MEIDDKQGATGAKGGGDGGQGIGGVLEVMIRVADEGDVDGVGGELDGSFGAEDGLDLGQPGLLGAGLDEVDEGGDDIDGEHAAGAADLGGDQGGEQAGAGADVGDPLSGVELQGADDFVAMVIDFAAFAFEAFDPGLGVELGIEVGIVDARTNTG